MSTKAYTEIVDSTNPNVVYRGKARNYLDPPTNLVPTMPSDAAWQITRVLTEGSIVYTQPLNDGEFIHVWDDRASYTWPDITPPFDQEFSIEFDRVDDYLSADLATVLPITRTTAWSTGFFVQFTNTGQIEALLSQMDVSATDPGWLLYKDASNFLNFIIQNETDENLISLTTNTGAIVDTNWHHIMVTVDGSSTAAGIAIYVDGDPVGITVNADFLTLPITNSAMLQVGRYDSFYLGGNIDELTFWDGELTAQEVLAIYDGGEGTDLTQLNFFGDCLVWARMGDGADDAYPTIVDVVSDLEFTMTNMTSGDIEANVP